MSTGRLLTERLTTASGAIGYARKINDRIYTTLYGVNIDDIVTIRDVEYRVVAAGCSWDRVTILTVTPKDQP